MKVLGKSENRVGYHFALVTVLLFGAMVVPVQGINYTFQAILNQNDVIGGRTVGSINDVALSDNGNIVFTGSTNIGSGGIFTPTSLVAQTGDVIGGQTIMLLPTQADINNAGDIVFTARLDSTAGGNDAVLTPTSVVANKDSVIAGRDILSVIGNPQINNSGTIAFNAQTEGGGSGIYTADSVLVHTDPSGPILSIAGADFGLNDAGVVGFQGRAPGGPSGIAGVATSASGFIAEAGPTSGIFGSGGDKWIGIGGASSLDAAINDNGVMAWYGNVTGNVPGLMASDGRLIAKAGDAVGSETLRDFTSNVAINNDDQVAYVGRFQTTNRAGVFVDGEAVAQFGDTILGLDLAAIAGTVDINNSGQVLFSATVRPEGVTTGSAISTLFLATPIPPAPTGNFVARLSTGSPVTLTQTIDTPTTGPASLEFDYLFQTTTGDLDVFLDGNLLGSLAAPTVLDTEFQTASFVLNSSLLNLTGVDLTFEMDGPTGSVILLDNVELDGSTLTNGDFQSGSLAPWTITTTGAGQVEIVPFAGVGVPEPATGLLCIFATAGLVRRRRHTD